MAKVTRTETGGTTGGGNGKRSSYGAKDITVLEGLDPVRKRPGMYIGSTGLKGLHHLVREVVDNAVDEAMAGHCDRIEVTIQADGSCLVTDNGRGIPVDKHPRFRTKTAAEIVMTTLHAGGKFGEGSGYKVSGGLHGVGVSVVNALSTRLELEIDSSLDHKRYQMSFHNGGKVKEKLHAVGKAPRGQTGTRITFWPDADIFAAEGTEFRAQTILEMLQTYAFLNKGLEIRFQDQREGQEREETFKYKGGITDFVAHLNHAKEPLFRKITQYEMVEADQEVEIALQWNTGYNEGIHSFANGIETAEGGMHEEGFKKALTNVVNRYGREKGILKEKEANLLGEDIREGLTAVISVRLREPQFEGQTKSKLGNVSVRSLVERATNEKLASWLEENPPEARKVVQKSVIASRARAAAKDARDLTRRKSALEGAGMPDKLRDCASGTAAEDAELFIIEGDSAGGTAVQARDPATQAILPLRGKILNVEKARLDKMMRNEVIQTVIAAIGSGVGNEDFEVEKARYHKVIIMADADVDGSHIRTLLLTFFFRHMKPLIDAGYVYIAQPPLFSTVVGKEKIYLKDDQAKEAFLAEHPDHKNEFNRLKGLGEMDYEELSETTMDKASRTLLRVTLDEAAAADEIVSVLMGENVEARKEFIVKNAKDVRFLDI